ncbi:MAG: hypothetical protein ACWGQW_23855, partial [bacterium]
GEFPLLDGSVSMCVRTGAASGVYQPIGAWMRLPTLTPAVIGDISGYFVGLYQSNTIGSTGGYLRCYRRINTSVVFVGSQFWIPNCYANWVQFEAQVQNSVVDVPIIRARWNTGPSFSEPGAVGWTAWTQMGTDTGHAGVTNQAGYWGFGVHHYSGTGGSSAEDWEHYFDNIRILAEVV